jgi:hypothetical protein
MRLENDALQMTPSFPNATIDRWTIRDVLPFANEKEPFRMLQPILNDFA